MIRRRNVYPEFISTPSVVDLRRMQGYVQYRVRLAAEEAGFNGRLSSLHFQHVLLPRQPLLDVREQGEQDPLRGPALHRQRVEGTTERHRRIHADTVPERRVRVRYTDVLLQGLVLALRPTPAGGREGKDVTEVVCMCVRARVRACVRACICWCVGAHVHAACMITLVTPFLFARIRNVREHSERLCQLMKYELERTCLIITTALRTIVIVDLCATTQQYTMQYYTAQCTSNTPLSRDANIKAIQSHSINLGWKSKLL